MRKLVLLSCFLVLLSVTSWAQRAISGKVTDDKGNPLTGISVVVKGTNTGTITSSDGTYSITVPANGKTLIFSGVDMTAKEVVIGSQNSVNITMLSADKSLQEVVVIGYGTQRRGAVTSAITKIKGSDLADIPVVSVDKQLAGKASGVNVTLGTGLVNAAPIIRIRGYNSLNLSRDPLFVIDGVPAFTGGFSSVSNTNSLSDINPNDIESVEVLKDGAATAIYGSRAANGVIMITTKKGRAGRSTLNYDMYVGSSSAFRKPDLLNAQEFVTIANEKLVNAGLTADARMNAENTNTDWLDVVFRKGAAVSSHSLSFSGGNEKTTFYTSLSYLNQQGIIQTNTAQRYAVRATVEHKANKFVKLGNSINLSRTIDNDQNNGGNALSGAMAAALRALPNVRVYNPAHPTGYNLTSPANDALGSDSNKRKIENNYVNIKYVLDKNKFLSDKYRMIDNAFIELSPISQIVIRSQGSIDYQSGTDFQFLDPIHGDGRSSNGILFEQSLQRTRLVWQNYANYIQSFGQHNVGATAGIELQRDVSRFFNGQGSSVSDVFFGQQNLISGTYVNQFSGGSYGKSGLRSTFARLSYDYSNRYFAQFTIRRDGQSSLAPEKRYGVFPGGSIGWRLSEESFWKNSALAKKINELKFRASYAVVGNPVTGFPYLSTYGPAPYGSVSGNAINAIGNPVLQWETNKKINAGVDLGLWNNRLNVTIDYFKNKNDNLIFADPTPPSLGIPGNSITRNIANMENKGWEFSISGDAYKSKSFNWNVNFNFTTQSNKVLALRDTTKDQVVPGPNTGTFNILRVGEPMFGIYGFEYAGVNALNGNPMWVKADGSLVQYNIAAGSAAGIYVVKPDGTLGAPSTLASTDRKILGSALPTYFGGFSNSFSYKGFALDVMFRFQGGNKVYNLTRQEVLLSQGFVNNGKEILNRWTPTNTNTDVPKLWYGRDNQINLQGQANSRFAENGNFIRLQSMMMSYNINKTMLQRITNNYVNSFRFYVQGQNLAIWTKYSGIDPENVSELGIDNSSVPQLRTITFGINVGF
jgi:TonB-dependent starch-binding outer membrane protein SusC